MAKKHTTKIIRTSKGLQAHLFNILDKLEEGDTTQQHARAVAAVANTAISLARLEMDHARFITDARAGRLTTKTPALAMGIEDDDD